MTVSSLIIGVACIGVALLIHEFAHAWMAYQLGDPTAKYEGRLTLNPLVHFDKIGALALTLTFWMSGGTMIMGWAKPVPINSENFKNRNLDIALVALAGPMINFIAAFICSLFVLTGLVAQTPVFPIFYYLIFANVGFGVFNLIPFPPLDGWKILGAIMPVSVTDQMQRFERKVGLWSLVILLVLLYFVGSWTLRPVFYAILSIFLGGYL